MDLYSLHCLTESAITMTNKKNTKKYKKNIKYFNMFKIKKVPLLSLDFLRVGVIESKVDE